MCTRIWWVLPVSRLHSSKDARAKRFATLKRVKAERPVGTTAMRVRCRGSRPTGALTSHEKSARVLVEPVHDTRPGNRRKLRRAVQERIEQGPFPVAASGMNHQARRLVDHQYVVVLVDDVERDRLGAKRRVHRAGLRADFYALAAPNLLVGLGGVRIEADVPLSQPPLQAVARMLGKHPREGFVQAQTGKSIGDASGDSRHGIIRRLTRRFRHET